MNRKKIKIKKKQRVTVVVLEGNKASTESTGVAPLCKALHDVVGPEDQLLVLTLLYWNNTNDVAAVPGSTTSPLALPFKSMLEPSSSSSSHDGRFFGVGNSTYGNFYTLNDIRTYDDDDNDHDDHQVQLHDNIPDAKFLYVQEIGQRKKAYAEVFKPFYLTCQTYRVKFEVKIAAGFRPNDIVIEEANNAKAKWIVMDRCFAKDPSFQLSGTKCNIISVSDDGDAIFHQSSNSGSPSAAMNKVQSEHNYIKLPKEPKSMMHPFDLCFKLPPISEPPSPSSTNSPKNEKLKMVLEPPIEGSSCSATLFPRRNDILSRRLCDPKFLLSLPLKLSREEIEEITFGYSVRISADESQHFVVFEGFSPIHKSRVLVKMFRGDSGGVFLEAERKAALSMRHKNVMRLLGYNQSEDTTFLVFPFSERGTLDLCLSVSAFGGREFKLTFQDKLRIAIGIAQGLRYMHEECPRGPIVHGKLLLSNVFIGFDLRPQISGFGVATWLHFKQARPILCERYSSFEDCSNRGLVAQVKSDVLSFGVLLLRLFCEIPVPQEDETLIKWARPLLLARAFHVLLGKDSEESEDLDMHEMFRVMCTALQCTMTRPYKRPCMSQVISSLKGENFCVMQSSP